MAGIGRRMPLTMSAFAIASVGMAGLPLVAGFVSKWYLLIGSVDAGYPIFAIVLLGSGILNIAYFWPIVYQAFFQTAAETDAKPVVEFSLGGQWHPIRTDGHGREYGDEHTEETDSDADADADDDADITAASDAVNNKQSDDTDSESSQRETALSGDPSDPNAETTYAVDMYPSDHTTADTEGSAQKTTADTIDDTDESIDPDSASSHNETLNTGMNRGQDSTGVDASSSTDSSSKSPTPDASLLNTPETEVDDNTDTSANIDHPDIDAPDDDDAYMSDPVWDRRTIYTESTWFMLGPIVIAVTGAVALGIIPQQVVFLSLIEQVVTAATGVII